MMDMGVAINWNERTVDKGNRQADVMVGTGSLDLGEGWMAGGRDGVAEE